MNAESVVNVNLDLFGTAANVSPETNVHPQKQRIPLFTMKPEKHEAHAIRMNSGMIVGLLVPKRVKVNWKSVRCNVCRDANVSQDLCETEINAYRKVFVPRAVPINPRNIAKLMRCILIVRKNAPASNSSVQATAVKYARD